MLKRNFVVFTICAALIVSMLAGCGKQEQTGSTGAAVTLNGDEIYPVQCDDTLTYWMTLNNVISSDFTNYGEIPLAQELEKRTGIKVEYIHPQAGQASEQFNIMIAGDNLPDMVQHPWDQYKGGPDKAIKDGYIIKLNDVFEKYAPNFYQYIKNDDDIIKKIKTDQGNYYTVPFIRGSDWLTTYQGLILRKDWLEKSGDTLPETIDELENVLTNFKEYSKGAPLVLTTSQKNYFMYAYNIGESFYLDDNTVKYGPAQPEYKDVLIRLNKWYENGLLDNNLVSIDDKYVKSHMLNDESGAFYGSVVAGIGMTLDAKPENTTLDLVAVQQITNVKTDIPEFSTKEDSVNLYVGTAISNNCKNVELAARYLDYGFTDEGNMLYNFGIEGVSYNMVDGQPKLSELLTNNPEGLALSKVAPRYLRASYSGPFVHDERYVGQSFVYPQQQQDAYDKWSKTNMGEHMLPPITLLAEEIDEDANMMGDITTYVKESFVSFVTGKQSIDTFDKYIEQLEKFGLSKVIDTRQSALERYNKR